MFRLSGGRAWGHQHCLLGVGDLPTEHSWTPPASVPGRRQPRGCWGVASGQLRGGELHSHTEAQGESHLQLDRSGDANSP